MTIAQLLRNPRIFDCPDDVTPGEHSAWLDKLFGFRVESIENELHLHAREKRPEGNVHTWGPGMHGGNQTWVGLSPQTLQTPYSELKHACDLIKPCTPSTLVDLGAGYGRLALILHQIDPGIKFMGYEYVEERVKEGNRIYENLGLTQAKLFQADLTSSDFILPHADYYFIYDYGQVAHIKQTIKQLEQLADHCSFKVIARGQGVRSIIEHEHPWLSQVHRPHREENFTIYFMEF